MISRLLIRLAGLWAGFTVALALAATARAQPTCPSNNVSACSLVNTSLPSDGRTCSACDIYGCSYISAHYDIPAATLSTSVSVIGEGGSSGGVSVQDDFRLIKLPPGTQVTLTVHLLVTLTNASGDLLASGHDVSAMADSNPLQTDLTVEIAAVADQPFRVQFALQGSGDSVSGPANGSGHFSFTGIPAGAAVISCNGYASDPTVPALTTSWGKLKRMYR